MRTRLMITFTTAALLAGAAFAQNDTAVNPPSSNQLPPSVATGNAATNSGRPSGQAGTATPRPRPPPRRPRAHQGAWAPGVNSPSSDAATVAPATGAPTQRAPSAAAGTDLIANRQVPDTPQNRAKYGVSRCRTPAS